MTSSRDFVTVGEKATYPKTFSVCCLVTDWGAYDKMRRACEDTGFVPGICEFLVADNTHGNKFTAFEAVRIFMRDACGAYVMIVHQDAFPLEPAGKLLERIGLVERHDAMWGVIGNAGVGGEAGPGSARSIEDPDRRHELGRPFVPVRTIDENVMIIRNGTGITASADVAGYHLYAFDVCSIARRLGYSCYVVDYMWRHESHGSIDGEFLDARDSMEAKLRAAGPARIEQTMCTALSAGGGTRGEFASAVQALWMLRNDQQRRGSGYRLLLERSARRWPVFPLVYHPLTAWRGLRRRLCAIWDRSVMRRVRGIARMAGWHFQWWRENWRSRLLPRKSTDAGESGVRVNKK